MIKIKNLFLPNKNGSEISMFVIGGFWVCLLLIIWTLCATSYIPTPIQTIGAFYRLWFDRGFGVALYDSLTLNIEAISVMFVLAYAVSVATVMPVFRPLATLISSGRFNGFVGLPLVFTSILHNPHSVKIALLVFGMGVFTVLSLVKMFEQIPKERFDHSRTLRMSEWRVVWEVVVLGSFNQVIDILRINIAMGYMLLPMVEGRYKFEGGVGALMEVDAKQFDYSAVFLASIFILLVGLFQDYLISVFKKIICPYSDLGLERSE